MRLLNADDMTVSGFTLITSEGNPITQENLDKMCDELTDLLGKYGFDIAIVCENEEAARIQAKIMIDRYWKTLDRVYQERLENV